MDTMQVIENMATPAGLEPATISLEGCRLSGEIRYLECKLFRQSGLFSGVPGRKCKPISSRQTPSMSTRTSPPKTARNRDCYQPLDNDSGGYVTGTFGICTQIAPKWPPHGLKGLGRKLEMGVAS